MTMPPLRYVGIRGESKYHAEVLLASRVLEDESDSDVAELRMRLDQFAEYLAVLPARQLKPQAVYKMK